MRRWKFLLIVFVTFFATILTPLPWLLSKSVPAPQILAQTQNDRKAEADRLLQQGVEQLNNSQPQAAIESWEKARIIYREIGNSLGEAIILGNIGIIYRGIGEYAKALENLNQVLKIMQSINNLKGQSRALQQLGLLHRALGNYERAIDFLNQQLKVAQAIPDRAEEAGAYGNMGLIYMDLEKYDEAIKNMQAQLTIAKEINDIGQQKTALSNLALVHVSFVNYDEAKTSYEQILAIKKARGEREDDAASLESLGLMYRAQRQHNRAIELFKQYFERAKADGDRRGMRVALNNLGVALYEAGRISEAERTLYDAIELGESLREELDNPNQVSIFETQNDTYGSLQEVLIVQNKFDKALEIAERGRARAFIKLLARLLSPQLENKLSPFSPTIEQIQQIAKEQNATLVEYSIIPQTAKLFIWIVTPTGKLSFRRVDLKRGQGTVPLDDRVTKPLQAFVSNTRESVIKEGAVASREETRGTPNQPSFAVGDLVKQKDDLPDSPPAVVEAVDTVKGTLTLSHPNWGGTRLTFSMSDVIKVESCRTSNEQLKEFYKLLIEPIADLLPKDPESYVIFIPQGSLFLIPFPALQDANGKYLIEKHTILTAPSIQVLDSTRKIGQRVAGSAKNVLVVGNPNPMPKASLKLGNPPEQLAPLPDSEQEANEVATLLNTKPITGTQATKSAIVSQLPNARIIHLATHGLLDSIKGLGSAIALAPSSNDNGLLTAEEILNMRLSAELVVLSACNTGSGRITGDGVIGLSRSLISAGTPSVIVSLWSVPDSPTAELMTEFYREWLKNPDKAKALRQAMLTTMQKHPQPRDWAAFTLIGSAE